MSCGCNNNKSFYAGSGCHCRDSATGNLTIVLVPGEFAPGILDNGDTRSGELGASSRSTLEGYLNLPQVKAGLDTIAWAEGAPSYNTLFGGGTFSGSQHPNRCIPYKNTCSTAAGRYQFLYRTWTGIASRLGLSDFGERNQDIAALALIEERGELAKLVNGDFEAMMRGLGCAWAALPYATCGQSRKSLSATMNYYRSALAVYGGASSSNLPPQGSAKLAPTTGALLGGGAGLLVLLAAIYAISD